MLRSHDPALPGAPVEAVACPNPNCFSAVRAAADIPHLSEIGAVYGNRLVCRTRLAVDAEISSRGCGTAVPKLVLRNRVAVGVGHAEQSGRLQRLALVNVAVCYTHRWRTIGSRVIRPVRELENLDIAKGVASIRRANALVEHAQGAVGLSRDSVL